MREKFLLKSDIERAQAETHSATAAAKFLQVSYNTYKKYCELYGIFKRNYSSAGVSRVRYEGSWGLNEIFEGKHPNYPHRRLVARLIDAGLRPGECELCGFSERRLDGRYPLKLTFKDNDSSNFELENLELYCYNCTFLTTGRMTRDITKDLSEPPAGPLSRSGIIDNDWESLDMDDDELEKFQDEMLEDLD